MDDQKPNPNQFVTQCAIACNEGAFAKWLQEAHPEAWSTALRDGEESLKDPEAKKVPTPTRAVYTLLGIKSRTELRTDPEKIAEWTKLNDGYRLWMQDV